MGKPIALIGLESALRRSAAITAAVKTEQEKATKKVLLCIEKDAKINAAKVFSPRGKRHDVLLNSISHRLLGVGHGEVGVFGNAGKYAAFVEYGTGMLGGGSPATFEGIPDFPDGYRPSGQPIRPVNAKVLRWEDPNERGKYIYARQTRGMPPYPFLRPAVSRNISKISMIVAEHYTAWIKEFQVR